MNIITPTGKKTVIARGVRKEKSKLAGGIEMFSLTELNVHYGKGEFGLVTGAKMKTFYSNLLVDLERNDIGRVSKIGSVKVPELFVIEPYANVNHLVATVEGRLKDNLDCIDVIKATFPGGSITGAPKIRAMEIIDELEPTQRNVYTGSIGYIGFNGDMDLNIAIRTIIKQGENVYFQVGGGMTWDSNPQDEYQETLDKAKSIMKALRGYYEE